jgi:hypothetical protein
MVVVSYSFRYTARVSLKTSDYRHCENWLKNQNRWFLLSLGTSFCLLRHLLFSKDRRVFTLYVNEQIVHSGSFGKKRRVVSCRTGSLVSQLQHALPPLYTSLPLQYSTGFDGSIGTED